MVFRLLLISLIAASCGGQRMVQTDLYFGQLKLDGSRVSEQQWNEFIARHVSQVFRQGSTVIEARGNWYDTASKKLVVEPSYIVTAINRPGRKMNKEIDDLRAAYKALHHQQSVLRVDRKVKASF